MVLLTIEKKEPKVSVVIVNFNYGRFIEDAIQSALGQTYPNIEVIVVDDGSTDNSREIIQKYAMSNKVTAIMKENGGVASAMNTGFSASSGDLVMFLDSDDVLKPQAIEVAVKAWYPGVSKVQWRQKVVDENLKPMGYCLPPLNSRLLSGDISKLVGRWFQYPSSLQSANLYSRSFLTRALPLDEKEWRSYADMPLIMSSPFCGDVVSLPQVLGLYRVHGKNLTGISFDLTPEKIKKNLELLRKTKAFIIDHFPEKKNALAVIGYDERKQLLVYDMQTGGKLHYIGRLAIGIGGAIDSLSFPFFTSMKKRLGAVLWFLLVGLLPKSIAKMVVSTTVH